MRFKARVGKESLANLNKFVKLLCEPGAKNAIILLGADKCRATVVTDDENLMLYATLESERVFELFNIESKSNNVIGLEVGLSNLSFALKAGPTASQLQIKLTKRGAVPYLSVEIQTVEGGLSIVQDVPVRMLTAVELERYGEPHIKDPAARLMLTSVRAMSAVVDRMRSLGAKTVSLSADMRLRELSVSAATDTASIKTYFRGLTDGTDGNDFEAPEGPVVASVAVRDIHKVLRANSSLETSSLMCLCPGSVILVHASLPDPAHPEVADGFGTLTFILATIGSHDD